MRFYCAYSLNVDACSSGFPRRTPRECPKFHSIIYDEHIKIVPACETLVVRYSSLSIFPSPCPRKKALAAGTRA